VKTETTTGSFLDTTSFTASYDDGNRLENCTGTVGNATRKNEAWSYDVQETVLKRMTGSQIGQVVV